MLTLIEQIKHGQVWDFHGGIHPPDNKKQSNGQVIDAVRIPDELVLPLKQHIGTSGKVLVDVGDIVKKGQPLTESDVIQCCPVHAPTSGEILAIEKRTIAHPSGLTDLCIVIRPDHQDDWGERKPVEGYQQQTPDDLIDHIRLMGVSGLGGAGFPTARKLQSGLARTEVLIINGAECEPYITADDRLMRENAADIVGGIRVLQHIVQPKLTVIAIESNKPEAAAAMQQALTPQDNAIVQVIPTKYPSGGEKQLIKLITGKEVPAKSIPAAIGVLMQNVGTVYAVKKAVIDGEPLIERVVTLTGKTMGQPGNRWTLLGTPADFLLQTHQYQPDKKQQRVIVGGPMMGFTLPHTHVPITKITNCILAPSRREIAVRREEMACIRCSSCADVCPVSLLPQQLQWYAKDQDYDKCQDYNLFDCIECGACAYVCPSEIPLVQYYRQAKAEIRNLEAEKHNAERARLRFEAKNARLEREKKQREERHKKAAADRRKSMENSKDGDAVAAAIARVKAKSEPKAGVAVKPAVAAAIAKAKAKQAEAAQSGNTEPDNTEMAKLREERKRQARERKAQMAAQDENTSSGEPSPAADTKKAAVADAIARAKARKAAQASAAPVSDEATGKPVTDADPKKAAVAAAIARAKARKATQDQAEAESANDEATNEPVTSEDPKKAAVAAAIARAKARKAAQAQPESEPAGDEATSEPVAAEDPKKAAVAAAIARAKARKAAQAQPESEPASEEATSEPVAAEDPKKAAVAAAIARAKARKAAQAQSEPEPASEEATSEPVAAEDPKKAAVAAAIARAKARKAAQAQSEPEPASEEATSEPVAAEDPKKAAVAAAIARAKARKAAQQKKDNEENE